MRAALVILLCAAMPIVAHAQNAEPLPGRYDAIIAIGWSGSEEKIHEYGHWHSSLFVGVTGGRYWTPHLKTEVEIAWQSAGSGQSYEEYEIPGGRVFATWDYRVRERRAGVAQLYQFGRNAWVHPFIGIGADMVSTAIDLDRPAGRQFAYIDNRSVPVPLPAAHEERKQFEIQPFLKTGLKMYVSDRAFLVTGLKLGFSPDLDHALWNVGLGIDF